MFVFCLNSYGVSRGIFFVIKSSGGFESSVGIEREKGIVVFTIYEVVSNDIPVRIGGIKFANDRINWLILSYRQRGS